MVSEYEKAARGQISRIYGIGAGLKRVTFLRHFRYTNAQWRLCFVWREGNAYEAEIVDYR